MIKNQSKKICKIKSKTQKKKNTFQPRQAYMTHFIKALDEVKPAFGMDDANLENKLKQGFFNYGEKFSKNYAKCQTFINEIKNE